MKKRVLSLLLCLCMVTSLLPVGAAAVDGCTHEHDVDCGYEDGVEGQPCAHVCDEACGGLTPEAPVCSVCGEAHEDADCPVTAVSALMDGLPTEAELRAMDAEAFDAAGYAITDAYEAYGEAYAYLTEAQQTLLPDADTAFAALFEVLMAGVNTYASGHSGHSGWTALAADTGTIAAGGNYYLAGDVTLSVPLKISGTDTVVTLCLSGHKLSFASTVILVVSGSTLNLCDCSGSGSVQCTGGGYGIDNAGTLTITDSVSVSSANNRGIQNAGTLKLSDSVSVSSGSYYGIYNSGTLNISGSASVASTNNYGVYNSSGKLYLSGSASVTSTNKYGVYLEGGSLNLSGTPAITGAYSAADIYRSSGASINANDGAATPAYYTGKDLTIGLYSPSSGTPVVYGVNAQNKGKFSLKSVYYELVDGTGNNAGRLVTRGVDQTIAWLDANGSTALTGASYPTTAEYGAALTPPALPGKSDFIPVGWLYSTDGGAWSSDLWTTAKRVGGATSFKALYVPAFSGDGTQASPYQISTPAQLQGLALLVKYGFTAYNSTTVYYQLTENLDLSGLCGSGIGSWTPIGNSSISFKAHLDGGGNTISGLYISGTGSYQGLFGVISGGTVQDLTLSGVSVTGNNYVGGVAGYITAGSITGCTVTGAVSGNNNYGAIVGEKVSNATVNSNTTTGCAVIPAGYTTDENNIMAYKNRSGTNFDVKGYYKDSWVKTTYDNYGYFTSTTNLSSSTVTADAQLINDGRYVQLRYTVKAGSSAITDGKLAVNADTMIGSNDEAAIEVIQNESGKVIGLKMVDDKDTSASQDAQFNLYFADAGGVTDVDTYWFGNFSKRQDNCYNQLDATNQESGETGTYTSDGSLITKFSGEDSGIAFSWQNISLAAGQSKTFSVILGVGEKSDPPKWGGGGESGTEPSSPIILKVDAQQASEKLVNVTASVTSVAGQTHTLYYDIDGGDSAKIGVFTAGTAGGLDTISGSISLNALGAGTHTLRFWVVNSSGAATPAVTKEITISAGGYISGGLDEGNIESITATVNLKKDGSLWANSNVALALYQDGASKYTLTDNNGVYTATDVEPGTYDVYADGVDTKLDVTGADAVTVDYYTVTYSKGSGAGSAPAAVAVLKGTNYTVDTNFPLSKPGYTQVGWNTSESATSLTSINNVSSAQTLYPVWTTIPAAAPTLTGDDPASVTYGYTTGGEMTVGVSNSDANTYGYSYAWYAGATATGDVLSTTESYTPTGLGAGDHEYTVRVTASRKDNGESAHVDKTFTVKVGQAEPTVTWPAITGIYVGDTLADTSLTGGVGAGGFSITGDKTWTSAGDKTTTITFTPSDTTNYKTVTNSGIAVTVSKRSITTENVTASAVTNKEYDTAFTSLGLPTTVSVDVNGKNNVSLGVSWDSSGYDPNTLEEQTITGTLTGTDEVDVGEKTATVKVTLKAKSVSAPAFSAKSETFTGSPISHTLATLPTGYAGAAYTYEGTSGTSYEKSQDAPTNVGAYTVTATFTMSYGYAQTEPVSATLTITAKAYGDGTGFTISDIADQTFTNSDVEPKPEVKFGNTRLTEGTDYDLSYDANTAIGDTAKVIVTFKGNFSGGTEKTFAIVPAALPGGKTNDDYFSVPAANANGWYNADIELTANPNITIGTGSAATGGVTISGGDTVSGSQTVFVKDAEGNIYQTTVSYKLDKTKPTITGVTEPSASWGKTDEVISFAAADATSDVESVAVTCGDGAAVTHTNNSFTADRNGEYTITVTDKAGNVETKVVTITRIDKTDPTAGFGTLSQVPASGWYTDDVSVPVSVADANLKEWYYSLDGGGTWIKGSDGSFIITANGDYTDKVKVKAVDQAGNETESAAISVKLDKAAPDAPTVDAKVGNANYTSDTWTAGDVAFTLTGTPTISGHAKYQYSTDNGGSWQDMTGSTLTHDSNTGAGGVSYLFRAVNNAGTEGSASTATVVKRSALDSTELDATKYTADALKIGGDAISEGWYTTVPTIAVTKPAKVGTNANALAAETHYKLYKAPDSGTDTTLTATDIFIPGDGTWTLVIWTKDTAGNKTPALTTTIKVDATKPTIESVTTPSTSWGKANEVISFTSGDATSGAESVTVTCDDGAKVAYTNGSFTADRNGSYTITVTDKAGNVETKAVTISKIDKTAPAIDIAPVIESGKWYGATEFTVTTDDGSGSGGVTLGVKQGEDNVTVQGGKFTATQSVAQSYAYTVTATDAVGNSASETVTLQIDTRIDVFMAKIDGLGNTPTYSELAAVKAWYDGQSALVKGHIAANDEAKAALDALLENFAEAAADAATDVISAIGDADSIEAIDAAKRDYDALPDKVKATVPADKKSELNTKVKDAQAAQLVKNLLTEAAKPGATYDDKKAAVEAYDKLSDGQKALITGSAGTYATVKADVDAIDAVIGKLDAVKTPYTPASKALIEEAEAAYNGLSQARKDIFPTEKKAELDALVEMLANVTTAEQLISALADAYNSANDEAIKAAKAAYDALTANEKAMVDGTLKTKLDTLYSALLAAKSVDERAALDFAAQVEEVKRDPSIEKITALETAYDKLSGDAKALLSDDTKNDYAALFADKEAAEAAIEFLEAVTSENIGESAATDALGAYDTLTPAQKTLADKATDNKADAIRDVQAALALIDAIPAHVDETEIGNDCGNQTVPHDASDHQSAVERAKEALDQLSDEAKAILPDEKKAAVDTEYRALLGYLEYISRAQTARTVVEVVGLADKVELPDDSSTAGKTVLVVEAKDSQPVLKPVAPAGKSEVLSVDITIKAYLYNDPDAEYGRDEPTAVETVQPITPVLVKLKVPSGYKTDTLEIWHVKDNGQRSRIADFQLTTESDGAYAVFTVSSFSHFIFFAEPAHTGGGAVTPTKPTVTQSEHGKVGVSPSDPAVGDTVTITVSPDEGWELDKLTVTDEKGRELKLTDLGSGKLSYTQPSGAVTITASFKLIAGLPFTDVGEADWFYGDVAYVFEHGLMQGTGDTTFSPHLTTTRGMLVTILYRLEGEPAVTGTCPFDDVTAGKYYEKAIFWAAANGIVEGYGNGKFGPEDPITREQMAVILWRYAKHKGYDVTASADLSKFTDEADISDYARPALSWANAGGLVTGLGGGVLDPGGSAERCQAAAILHRFCVNSAK